MNVLESLISLIHSFGITTVVTQDSNSNYKSAFSNWNYYSVFDRRSMAYYAMGVSQELNKPVLLIVEDSSDATLSDILSGITEAYYQNVPLLVLNIKGESDWMQEDKTVIGDKCVYSCEIQETVEGLNAEDIIKVNYAISALEEKGGGPVYIGLRPNNLRKAPISIPFIQYMSDSTFLKDPDLIKNLFTDKPVLLVLDATDKYTDDDIIKLTKFCKMYNATIFKDDIYIAKRYLDSSDFKSDAVVIEFGSKHVYSLENVEKGFHITVTPDEMVKRITNLHVHISWRKFISKLCNISRNEVINLSEKQYADFSNKNWACRDIIKVIADSINHETWVYGFSINGQKISDIFASNPHLRSASYVECTGKDGNLSVFVGQSVVQQNSICICFIDQKKFFLDMNALHIQAIGNNIGIVVFCEKNYITKVVKWSESCGFSTDVVYNFNGLNRNLEKLCCIKREKPYLLALQL